MTAPARDAVYGGTRPRHAGDLLTGEEAGRAATPLANRYATPKRMAPTWAGPNAEASSLAIGTLGVLALGLGFRGTEWAIVIGVLTGAAPVAALGVMGARTGAGQMVLARLAFGRSSVLPVLIQWLSSVGWIAITCLFGAQALAALLHLPFAAAAVIVVAAVMLISIRGYEVASAAQVAAVVIMTVVFGLLTWRVAAQPHLVLAPARLRGAGEAGAFAAMVTIAASGAFSWASSASDYTRYQRQDAPARSVSGWSFLGLAGIYLWLATLGNIAASLLTDQTGVGIAKVIGGGVPELFQAALAAVAFAAATSSSFNDYSAGIAVQAAGVPVKRPYLSVVNSVIAFGLILWIGTGAAASQRLINLLLLTAYWCAGFAAITGLHWWLILRPQLAGVRAAAAGGHGPDVPAWVDERAEWRNLPPGWQAGAALAVSFAAMLPFMDTAYMYGWVARALHGADFALLAGAIVGGGFYLAVIWRAAARQRAADAAPAVAAPAGPVATPG